MGKKLRVVLIASPLIACFVMGGGENHQDSYSVEATPYEPSQITEEMVTPVYYTMAFTEEEKAELENEGFHCVKIEQLGPGGSEGGVHWIGELLDRRWHCDKEKEEPPEAGIVLLDKSGSFVGVERGLCGSCLLSKPAVEYQVIVPQAGRLEWFYGYGMQKRDFANLYAQGFCHKYHYSPLKVYNSKGECYEGHKGSLVVSKGETITFEVFRQLHSIRDCEDEEILDWAALAQMYWLKVELFVSTPVSTPLGPEMPRFCSIEIVGSDEGLVMEINEPARYSVPRGMAHFYGKKARRVG